MKALVIEQHALVVLSTAAIEDAWFGTFNLPDDSGLRGIEIKDIRYILSRRADEKSRLLVINTTTEGIFVHAKSPRHAFERIIHVALSQFENGVSIPIKWRLFQEGTLLSIYAQPEAIASAQRTYFDRSPRQTDHVYAYALTEKVENFDDVGMNIDLFAECLDNYLDAVLATPTSNGNKGAFGITLTEPLGKSLVGNHSLADW